MIFRRRRGEEAYPTDETDGVGSLEESVDETAAAASAPSRPGGPWDAADAPEDGLERFDLGGLRVPMTEGIQLQLEVGQDGSVLPTVMHATSALQLAAFAAPKRSGIWAEVRAEIADSLRADGGSAEEVDGPFGPELRAEVPGQDERGARVVQPVRFVGVDGPRWFLRGLFTAEAARDPEAAAPLEAVFRGVVVVRGHEAMAPRDQIPLQVPPEVLQASGMPAPPGTVPPPDPFQRGPEITEIR